MSSIHALCNTDFIIASYIPFTRYIIIIRHNCFMSSLKIHSLICVLFVHGCPICCFAILSKPCPFISQSSGEPISNNNKLLAIMPYKDFCWT